MRVGDDMSCFQDLHDVSKTEEDTGAKTETHKGTNLCPFLQLSPYCYLFHALHLHVYVCECVCLCVSSTGHLHGVAELTHALGAVRVCACSVAGTVHRAAAGQRGSARACQSSHTG